jgi:DNA-binding transcriptional regulator YiaG
MKTEKIIKKYIYEGLGVPILILNAPFKMMLGELVLDIDLNKLQKELIKALIHKPAPLNGNELRFIRKYFEMTTSAFGNLLGVTHPAVLKWEKGTSQIPPTTEKYVRLYAYDQLKAKNDEFRRFFAEISSEKIVKHPKAKAKTITVDAADMRMVA